MFYLGFESSSESRVDFHKCQVSGKRISNWISTTRTKDVYNNYTLLGVTRNKTNCLFICCHREWCHSIIYLDHKCYGKSKTSKEHAKDFRKLINVEPKRRDNTQETKKEGTYLLVFPFVLLLLVLKTRIRMMICILYS